MNSHPPEKMSFEEALAALEDIVTRLESAKVPLEDSIALYQRGEALRSRCETLLGAAEMKVSRIVAGKDGDPATEPMDPPALSSPAKTADATTEARDDDIPF